MLTTIVVNEIKQAASTTKIWQSFRGALAGDVGRGDGDQRNLRLHLCHSRRPFLKMA